MRALRQTPKACVAILAAGLLTACIQVPELDDAVSPSARDAPYPELQPLTPGDFGATTTAEPENEVQEDLNRRIAALQARADRLRQPVVDDATRTRLEEGVAQ